jgi:DNA-binding transcriptional LysR family regulator
MGHTASRKEYLGPMFKPHHVELFYYVARYGGISAASRHIPYGLDQPAISGQITDFERQLGRSLFERRPFQLT